MIIFNYNLLENQSEFYSQFSTCETHLALKFHVYISSYIYSKNIIYFGLWSIYKCILSRQFSAIYYGCSYFLF